MKEDQKIWEDIFASGDTIWGKEPADSARKAVEVFQENNCHTVFIPGIGYGRNIPPFLEKGMKVSGIEWSLNATNTCSKNFTHNVEIQTGSILNTINLNIPVDAIFCYSLLHLFNRKERKQVLSNCFELLEAGGIMIFTVLSIHDQLYGQGKWISRNRYRLPNRLSCYFYDETAIQNEFSAYDLSDYQLLEEPIKFLPDQKPLQCFYVICKKK